MPNNGAEMNKRIHMTNLARWGQDEAFARLDRVMNEVFGEFPLSIQPYAKTSYPRVDVIEYPDKLVLEAEIAGLNKEDVSVDLEGDTLVIRGGKKQQAESDTSKGRYLFKEIKRSSFSRSFVLGDGIDKTAIKADFKDGTLKVELPRLKPEDKKPRHVKLL